MAKINEMTTNRQRQLRRRQAGQSVIIAIAVLFILAFLAALFVILLANNLQRTARQSQTLTADFYSQAGIRYADQMLTTSPQGADWRPPLQNKLASTSALSADEAAQYGLISSGLSAIATNDPDAFWLKQGFTRYNTQGGRFLLRLSYGAQKPGSPFENDDTQTGKYIKIESIGRTGEIAYIAGEPDPTSFRPQPIRLHAEQIAYKPIGVTDYARFITNKDNRTDTATLGVPSLIDPSWGGSGTSQVVTPGVFDFYGAATGSVLSLKQFPIITVYGDPATQQGGSLRSNASLRLYGANAAFLNGTAGDDWEVAGNLTFDGYNATASALTALPTQLTVAGSDITGAAVTAAAGPNAYPSNDTTNFTTLGGLIRDSQSNADKNGFPRAIKRLSPPLIDTVDPTTRLARYQAATVTGSDDGPYRPAQAPPTGAAVAATSPATVYIDNINDVQPESANVYSGSYTLRDDWLNRISSAWQGPFYNPPGATIVFGPIYVPVSGGAPTQMWGFTVTRTDAPVGLTAGSPTTWQWTKPGGAAGKLAVPVIAYVYGAQPAGYTPDPSRSVFFLNADNPTNSLTPTAQTANNDIVIYARGNIRVRGVISDPGTISSGSFTTSGSTTDHHVTLVTDQIAYIEGSILKGGPGYQVATASSIAGTQSYLSYSSAAILARRYVCVNTTQFLAGAVDTTDLDETSLDRDTHSVIFHLNSLTEAFDLPPVNYLNSANGTVSLKLFVSQFSSDQGAALGHLDFAQVWPTGPQEAESFDGTSQSALTGSANTPNRQQFGLTYLPSGGTQTAYQPQTSGYSALQFKFSRSVGSTYDYLLQRAAILPSDVRIEAALYAEDNSFFVIPGPWFNDDTQDTLEKVAGASPPGRPRPSNGGTGLQGLTDPLFPFYGQPIDMKITVAGAVAENLPANIADQSAWMLKWGWIPKVHGTPSGVTAGTLSGDQIPTSHTATTAVAVTDEPGLGLSIQYDPMLGSASISTGGGTRYVRLDPYGRPLPYAPNLPVSPDLLYSGQTTGASLVQ